MKLSLIENWREAPKFYSIWAFASIATIQGVTKGFLTLDQLASRVLFYPDWTWGGLVDAVVAFLAVTGLVGRLISQSPKDEPAD
jgi:hypothetical protein